MSSRRTPSTAFVRMERSGRRARLPRPRYDVWGGARGAAPKSFRTEGLGSVAVAHAALAAARRGRRALRRDHVVDAQDHVRDLDGGAERLALDALGLDHVELPHV